MSDNHSDKQQAAQVTMEEFTRIIPRENSGAFESWQLPQVEEIGQPQDMQEDLVPMLTAAEIEQIQKQAYAEGYEQGKRQGLKDGFEQGEEEGKKQGRQQAFEASLKDIQEQAFHFAQLYKTLAQPLQWIDKQVQYELVQLALSIAKTVIGQELETRPELIVEIVKQCLHLLPSAASDMQISLHPDDLQMIEEAMKQAQINLSGKEKLLANSEITRGGCVVDSSLSHIDARIEARIEAVAKNILIAAPQSTQQQKYEPDEMDASEKISAQHSDSVVDNSQTQQQAQPQQVAEPVQVSTSTPTDDETTPVAPADQPAPDASMAMEETAQQTSD